MRLPTNESATAKALRTALSALGGFAIGLVVVIWQVPGVPDAISVYVSKHAVELLLSFGIPSIVGTGLVNYIISYFRPSVKRMY